MWVRYFFLFFFLHNWKKKAGIQSVFRGGRGMSRTFSDQRGNCCSCTGWMGGDFSFVPFFIPFRFYQTSGRDGVRKIERAVASSWRYNFNLSIVFFGPAGSHRDRTEILSAVPYPFLLLVRLSSYYQNDRKTRCPLSAYSAKDYGRMKPPLEDKSLSRPRSVTETVIYLYIFF